MSNEGCGHKNKWNCLYLHPITSFGLKMRVECVEGNRKGLLSVTTRTGFSEVEKMKRRGEEVRFHRLEIRQIYTKNVSEVNTEKVGEGAETPQIVIFLVEL